MNPSFSLPSFEECLSRILAPNGKLRAGRKLAQEILETLAQGMGETEQENAIFHALESQDPGLIAVLFQKPANLKLWACFEFARRYELYRARLRRKASTPSPLNLLDQAARKVADRERSALKEWLGFVPLYPNGALGGHCVIER